MGPYIHGVLEFAGFLYSGVLVFDGSLDSWSACVRWVLIYRGYLYLMNPYIHKVLVFDGSLYSGGTCI